jgi:prevent-host-death family protein
LIQPDGGGVKTVNIYEAKTHLTGLIEDVARGDEVIIARHGRPVARLLPIAPRLLPRRPGQWRGKVWIGAEFDDPLPSDVVGDFRR